MSGAATPRLASTIILLKDEPAGVETFMVVRHREIDFASGALVFPGGGWRRRTRSWPLRSARAPIRSPRSKSPRSARRSRNAAC